MSSSSLFATFESDKISSRESTFIVATPALAACSRKKAALAGPFTMIFSGGTRDNLAKYNSKGETTSAQAPSFFRISHIAGR
jgi:hypothetical protein